MSVVMRQSQVSPGPLRFLHIPKTGGVTFISCLDRIYRSGGGVVHLDVPVKKSLQHLLPEDVRRSVRLLTGHTSFETGIFELDSMPCVTFLRHPLARVRSYCQHVSEGKSPHLKRRFPPDRFDLDRFLDSGDYGLENLQVRELSNCSVPLDRGNFKPYLERAIHVLRDRMACFGLTERFDESLVLMRARFAWPWPVYQRLNSADKSRKLSFTSEREERIRDLNFADLLLYEAAREIFEQRAGERGRAIRRALQVFRARQSLDLALARLGDYRSRAWELGRKAMLR